jgi:hypothetical protein
MEKQAQAPFPPIGPDALYLERKEIDALYDLLDLLVNCLGKLSAQYTLLGQALFGAIRSQSILINSGKSLQIGILDHKWANKVQSEYVRVIQLLPSMLGKAVQFQAHPVRGCDRIRFRKVPSVCIDIFCLRRIEYETELDEFISRIGLNEGKLNSSNSNRPCVPVWVLQELFTAGSSSSFGGYFYESELLPLSPALTFGPLRSLSGPCKPLQILFRCFGADSFEMFYPSIFSCFYGLADDRSHSGTSTTNLLLLESS